MLRILLISVALLFASLNGASAQTYQNTTAEVSPACSTSAANMVGATLACRATPNRYEVTMYEMGMCTSDPFANGANGTFDRTSCTTVFENTAGFTYDFGAEIGADVTLEGTTSRPAEGTYKYPYLVMLNRMIVGGAFTLDNGTTYYGNAGNLTTVAGSASDYTDPLTNFGDVGSCTSGYLNSAVSVGTISGFLVDTDLVRPLSNDFSGGANQNCGGVTVTVSRLVGVMNLTSPFTINADTVGFSFNFILTDYGVQYFDDDNNTVPDGFGSGPFSGQFKVTTR